MHTLYCHRLGIAYSMKKSSQLVIETFVAQYTAAKNEDDVNLAFQEAVELEVEEGIVFDHLLSSVGLQGKSDDPEYRDRYKSLRINQLLGSKKVAVKEAARFDKICTDLLAAKESVKALEKNRPQFKSETSDQTIKEVQASLLADRQNELAPNKKMAASLSWALTLGMMMLIMSGSILLILPETSKIDLRVAVFAGCAFSAFVFMSKRKLQNEKALQINQEHDDLANDESYIKELALYVDNAEFHETMKQIDELRVSCEDMESSSKASFGRLARVFG
ncbi:hypothetical protein N8137_05020 [Porticoccaceae bacterium]|nr:hypothetical protein [Porticoccaceae bacterium]MDC1477458.1 hypothetical protein [Porticoccaceae bacterium]